MTSKQALAWHKMKSANEREGRYLDMKLRDLAKKHAENLQQLHKEKCDTTAELRSFYFRQLRSDARRRLYGNHFNSLDVINPDQMENGHKSNYVKQDFERRALQTWRKPFEPKLETHLPNVIYRPVKRHTISGQNRSGSTRLNMPGGTETGGNVLCVFYQPANNIDNIQRHMKYNTVLPRLVRNESSIKVLDRSGKVVPLRSIPRKDLPSYVSELRHLRPDQFDPYTDGAMALAVRRFRQIQRESMPPLPGHLPVRVRYDLDYDARRTISVIRERLRLLDPDNAEPPVERSLPSISLKWSKRAQIAAEINAMEVKNNNEKLHKLKKADQVIKYKNTLTRIDTFIGASSKGTNLIQEEILSPEERFMLKSLNTKQQNRS